MSTPRNGISKHQRADKVSGQGGPFWILIAEGALLSTLSIRFGYKLKQSLDFKPRQSNASAGLKANGTSERPKSVGCCLHSHTSSSAHKNDYSCFHSIPGTVNVDGKEETNEQMVSASDTSLPLVMVPAPSYSKENGVMWTSSPDRLELPPRPYNHHSTCSDSPCVSETKKSTAKRMGRSGAGGAGGKHHPFVYKVQSHRFKCIYILKDSIIETPLEIHFPFGSLTIPQNIKNINLILRTLMVGNTIGGALRSLYIFSKVLN
ncbi:unnamed protein product [Eruca vesicaria subsp. sativa]|uniref:Uncharacterized protein n=1 Tax=Eruca vesicaria subsp. sativa TaxID=29727 RepID=A0ABC8JCJ9_ERUVS|nr:unnamed protein product [Eruca vesicaria subsp. sativa]